MSTTSINIHQAAVPLATGMGLLGIGGGIYSLINPVAFSDGFGIPITSPSSPALPFVSFAGARNLTSGISGLLLLYSGQRKAAGLAMMSGVTTAMIDSWICAEYGAKKGKAASHAIMGIVIGVIGGGLYWG
ncbi:hypothetical protein P7C71_g1341, partial [Lecanoromycetidae sp. Uapishka_2]